MDQGKHLDDARFKRTSAALALALGELSPGLIVKPLARTAWVDGDTTTPPGEETGSIAAPYKTLSAWLAAIPSPAASAADANTSEVALVSPAVAGYAAPLAIPPYRSVIVAADAAGPEPVQIAGPVTWNNTSPGGPAPAFASLTFDGVSLTGGLTVTDSGALGAVLIFVGQGSYVQPLCSASGVDIVATGASALSIVLFDGYSTNGISVDVPNSVVNGWASSFFGGVGKTFTCKSGTFVNCQFRIPLVVENGTVLFERSIVANTVTIVAGRLLAYYARINSNVTVAGGASPQFQGCIFGGAGQTLTNNNLSPNNDSIFDGMSWTSFQSAGGVLAGAAPNAYVIGGYKKGAIQNAASFIGSGTFGIRAFSGGSLANGFNWYQSTGLGAGTIHLAPVTAGAAPGDTMAFFVESAGGTINIQDDTGATLYSVGANQTATVVLVFSTTSAGHWTLLEAP
jgi:hypothetical protein